LVDFLQETLFNRGNLSSAVLPAFSAHLALALLFRRLFSEDVTNTPFDGLDMTLRAVIILVDVIFYYILKHVGV